MLYGHFFKLDTTVSDIERGIAIFRYCPAGDGNTDDKIRVAFSSGGIEFNAVGGGKNVVILRIPFSENLRKSFAETLADTSDRDAGEGFDFRAATATDAKNSYFATFPENVIKKTKRSQKEEMKAPLRKLILDFLFDFQETSIFEMSPHHSSLLGISLENYFARCLAAKARYYYKRTSYQNILKENHEATTLEEQKARREFYGEMLFNAEKEWTDCIRDPRSDKTFRDSNGWFEPSEDELKHVYRPYLNICLSELLAEKKRLDNKASSRWFTKRYSWLFPWSRVFCAVSFFDWHLVLPRLWLAMIAAWIPFFHTGLVQSQREETYWQKLWANLVPNLSQSPKLNMNDVKIEFLVPIIFGIVLIGSCLTIRRTIPLRKKVVVKKAVVLTLISSLFSFVVGLLFYMIFGEKFEPTSHPFLFFWSSAVFIGMMLQLLFFDISPSEPI